MTTKLSWALVAVVCALSGCGGAAVRPGTLPTAQVETPSDPSLLGLGETESPSAQGEARASADFASDETANVDPSTLPEAPWSAETVSMREAPSALVHAWERADNRDGCRPLVPVALGAASGARARATEVHGGWAVEFDRRGLPGVGRDGEPCESCGRGVFGIAGTSMMPEDLVDPESDASAPLPTYRDGSYAELDIEGEEAGEGAAATLTVVGENCVYQVWSFLGPEHVEELVAGLRLVELPEARGTEAVASAE